MILVLLILELFEIILFPADFIPHSGINQRVDPLDRMNASSTQFVELYVHPNPPIHKLLDDNYPLEI